MIRRVALFAAGVDILSAEGHIRVAVCAGNELQVIVGLLSHQAVSLRVSANRFKVKLTWILVEPLVKLSNNRRLELTKGRFLQGCNCQ